eukprot:gene11179-23353_t
MEWQSGATDFKFFHTFTSLPHVGNSVIEYDVKNVNKVLSKKSLSSGETIAKRVNGHYRDSLRHIKRSFGIQHQDDFQRYTWGFVLTVDLGLDIEKLELLNQVYSIEHYPRFGKPDYEKILHLHSSFRNISNEHVKRVKWRDLKASWGIQANKRLTSQPTISKKDFLKIIDVNEVKLEIDIDVLSQDMMIYDQEAARLHLLLLDDPVVNGRTQSIGMGMIRPPSGNMTTTAVSKHTLHPNSMRTTRKPQFSVPSQSTASSSMVKDHPDRKVMEAFLKLMEDEESEYGEAVKERAEEAMRIEFELRDSAVRKRKETYSSRLKVVEAERAKERQEDIARMLDIQTKRKQELNLAETNPVSHGCDSRSSQSQ